MSLSAHLTRLAFDDDDDDDDDVVDGFAAAASPIAENFLLPHVN